MKHRTGTNRLRFRQWYRESHHTGRRATPTGCAGYAAPPGMPHQGRRSLAPRLHLLRATPSCVLLLSSCSPWSKQIHPDFSQTFVDISRRGDDDAVMAVFDPELRVLAIGRESGRLELWDTTQTEARVMRQAHMLRTEFIAFGREDGIVLTNSTFTDDPINRKNGTRIWDAHTGEMLHELTGFWAPDRLRRAPSGVCL